MPGFFPFILFPKSFYILLLFLFRIRKVLASLMWFQHFFVLDTHRSSYKQLKCKLSNMINYMAIWGSFSSIEEILNKIFA